VLISVKNSSKVVVVIRLLQRTWICFGEIDKPIQHSWVCVLCVCSFPREFVESEVNDLSYYVAVGTFDDIRQGAFIMPSTHLDKLIIAHLPVFGGSAWENLQRIPLRDMLVFSDVFPYRAASPLPPYSGPAPPPPPPPPPQTYLGDYTPPPPCTPQYSPESPDQDGYSPGITSFPPYYSPSLITYPPTPNAAPPSDTPSAPPRAPPRPRCIPQCRLIYNEDESSTDEDNEVKFICKDCVGLGRGRGRLPSYK